MTKKKFSYKEAYSEIEKIIDQIENEELDVDELSDKVEKASKLINQCKDKLRKTESKLEDIFKEER